MALFVQVNSGTDNTKLILVERDLTVRVFPVGFKGVGHHAKVSKLTPNQMFVALNMNTTVTVRANDLSCVNARFLCQVCELRKFWCFCGLLD